MSALREVLAIFDIVVNDEALEAGSKKLDSFVGKLKMAATAFAGFGLIKSISSFGEHVAEAAREAEFGAARIGMTSGEYQKLAQVADNYGVKVEQLQISTRMLIRGLSDAGGTMGTFSSRTHFAKDALRNLNVDAAQFKGKGIADILPVIADGFKGVQDPVERTAIALRLFGHRGLSILPMMAAGGEELRRQFAAALPVFEEATIESANKATIAGKQLSRTWDNLVNNSFGKAVLDSFAVTAQKLTDILLVVKDLIKNSEIGKGVLAALGIAMVVAAGIAVAAWWPVLVPILAVVAAIAALSLAIDDFIVFMQGGHSVIGRFFNELLGEGGADKARDFIKDLWEKFKGFMEDLKSWALPKIFEEMKNALAAIRDRIHEIKSGWASFKGFFDNIANKTGLTDENIANAARKAWDATKGFANTVAEGVQPENIGAFVTGNFTPSGGAPGSVAPPAAVAPPFSMVPQDDHGTGKMLSPTYVFPGAIDVHELAGKVRSVVDAHTEQKLREVSAAAGGTP